MTNAVHSSSAPDGTPLGDPAGLRDPGTRHADDLRRRRHRACTRTWASIGELYTPVHRDPADRRPLHDGPAARPPTRARLVAAPEIVPGHYGTFGLLTGTPEALRERARAHRRRAPRCTRRARARSCGPSRDVLDRRPATPTPQAARASRWHRSSWPSARSCRGSRPRSARSRRRRSPTRATGRDGLAQLRDGASAREALDAAARGRSGPRRPPGRHRRRPRPRRRRTPARAACPGPAGAPAPATRRRATSSPGPAVVDAMADGLRGRAAGDARRPPARSALAAGDAAGGDRRGRQSAAIAVVAPGGRLRRQRRHAWSTCASTTTDPVRELRRLYGIHVLLNGTTPEEQKLPLDGDLARRGARAAGARRLSGEPARRPARRAARVRGRREPRGALVARARGSIRSCSSTCAPAPPDFRGRSAGSRAAARRRTRRVCRGARGRRAALAAIVGGGVVTGTGVRSRISSHTARAEASGRTRMRCAMHGSNRLRTCLTATSAALSSSAAAWAQRYIESSARGEAPTSTSGCSRVERSRRTR